MRIRDAAKVFLGGVLACLSCVLALVLGKRRGADAGGVHADSPEHDERAESLDRIGECAGEARRAAADARKSVEESVRILREAEARSKE